MCRKRLSIIELSATYAGDGFQKEQLGRFMHCKGLIDKVVRERVLLVAAGPGRSPVSSQVDACVYLVFGISY